MKFRDPWIDPRIVQVRPPSVQAYLLQHGWKPLGPAANPDLLLFDGPSAGESQPILSVPVHMNQGPDIQRMIELIAELALFEDRYAVDVLNDILQQPPLERPPNGEGSVPAPPVERIHRK